MEAMIVNREREAEKEEPVAVEIGERLGKGWRCWIGLGRVLSWLPRGMGSSCTARVALTDS